jgi:hypothetical protein
MTGSASSLAVQPVRVGFVEWMPSYAMRLRRVIGSWRFTSADILAVWHRVKMARPDTPPTPTPVVKFASRWDLSDEQLVHEAMSQKTLSTALRANSDSPISEAINMANPRPAMIAHEERLSKTIQPFVM